MAKKLESRFEEAKVSFDTWLGHVFGGKGPGKTAAQSAAAVEKNTKAFFSNLSEKFDLVTRKEFDAQQRTLMLALKKLDQIEKTLKGGAKKPAAKKKAAKKSAKKKT